MGILNTRTITQTNKGVKMNKKYKYEVEEYSQDTRSFYVESDIELTHDEINECVSSASFNEHTKTGTEIKGHKVYTQYTGTDFGDDCQINISEVE
jgi:hypothetical protein